MDTGDFPNAGNPNRGDRRGATSRRPTAGNPNRRDRRGTRAAASGRPGVDDGWDPNPATGLPPRELGLELRGEWCSLSEQTRHEQQLLNEAIISGGDVHYHRERLHELLLRSSEMLMQASSSAAPPSDHPEAERTGSGMRVRQSVLYSNRPRRSRPRRPSQHLEHPSEVSSREVELEVANVSTFEAPSVRETSIASPSDHPEAEGSVTGTHIRQSALYSSRPRRPRRRHAPLPTEDHPSEVSTSELGGAVTDLPTLDEALSLSDPPPLTPQISDEETTDDDDACSHLYRPRDDGRSISPRVLTKSMLESLGDRFFPTVPYEAMRRPDLHVDSEEFIREMKEYSDKHPPVSLEEAFDSIWAVEHAALTALAAKKGIEPPRDPFLVDQEAPLLQAQQEDSASAPHSQDSIAISHEASTEVVQDGKQWMRDEVTLCFRKHVERTSYLAGVVFELDELCHQCFNVENYMKVFHHYNFKIRMKMPAAVEWTEELCFGEVKEIFGTKSYFCCPLEPNESGHCYACQNQGVEDLRHPVTGGFETGLPDAPIPNFWYIDDDEAGDR